MSHRQCLSVVLGLRLLSGCVRGCVKLNVFSSGYIQKKHNNTGLVTRYLLIHSISRLFRNSLVDK